MQWKVVIFLSGMVFLPVFSFFCAEGQSLRRVHVQALVHLSSVAKEQVYWLTKGSCVTITLKSTTQWSAGESSSFPSTLPKTLLGRPAVSTKCQSSPTASVTSDCKKGLLIINTPAPSLKVKPSPACPLKLLLVEKWGNREKMMQHARNPRQRNPLPHCPLLDSSNFF